ncbi:MAG: hypothetical protein JXQ72_05315 [Anaerolineae bacterium]|nr:hypothetical protein [Anaerolineae bacterium]
MPQQTSLEITVNVVIREAPTGAAEAEIIEWQVNVQPPEAFRALSAAQRAALWSSLRDEIEEYWLGTVLEGDTAATWNYLLEDVDINLEDVEAD